MMFDSLSASIIDVDKYTWLKYKGKRSTSFKKHNRYNDLTLKEGNIFGYRVTRNKSVYLVREDAQSVIFSISSSEFNSLEKKAAPYSRRVLQQTVTKKVVTRDRKNASSRFKPSAIPKKENEVIDRKNYLWYKYSDSKNFILLNKRGGLVETLTRNAIFGLRIISPARGGMLCLEGGSRIGVSTLKFDALVEASVELHTQPKGTILPARKVKVTVSDEVKSLQDAFGIASPEERKPKAKKKKKKKVKKGNLRASREDPSPVYEEEEHTIIFEEERAAKLAKQEISDIEFDEIQELDDLFSDDDLDWEEGEDDVDTDGSQEERKPKPTKKKKKNVNIQEVEEPVEEPVEDNNPDTVTLDENEESDSELDSKLAEEEHLVPTKGKGHDDPDLFKEGYVIKFRKDKQEREYVIVDKYPYPDNDKLTLYVVYDTNNKPEFTQKLRLRSDLPEHSLSKYTTKLEHSEEWSAKIPQLLKLPESNEPVYG